MAFTWPVGAVLAPVENEDAIEASALRSAKCTAVVGDAAPLGCSAVKLPPMKTCPLESKLTVSTCPFGLGRNVVSTAPAEVTRATLLTSVPVTAPFGANEVKFPPTIMLPLDWRASDRTVKLGSGKNVVSSVPSGFRRARLLT
jgi:hypothetical protein